MAAGFRLAGRYFETKEARLDEWIKLLDERVRIGRKRVPDAMEGPDHEAQSPAVGCTF
jgi:hypothetical protein